MRRRWWTAGGVLLLLLLAGCFESATPFFAEAEGFTPLPDAVAVVELEAGAPRKAIARLQRHAGAYDVHSLEGDEEVDRAVLVPLAGGGLLLVQLAAPTFTQYYLVRLRDGRFDYLGPTAGYPGLDREQYENGIKVADRAALMRMVEALLDSGQTEVVRAYRWLDLSQPAERAVFERLRPPR